jgi:hypothetical protein
MLSDIFDTGLQIAMSVVEERLPIGDKELQVANLRAVQRGKIDFADYTV